MLQSRGKHPALVDAIIRDIEDANAITQNSDYDSDLFNYLAKHKLGTIRLLPGWSNEVESLLLPVLTGIINEIAAEVDAEIERRGEK